MCCNLACTAACQACSAALTGGTNGTCADVTNGSADPRMLCDDPPSSTCTSVTTVRTYAASGTCAAGACSYATSDSTCAYGCAGGACTGKATTLNASHQHTCAVVGGGVQCWGLNTYGQLGDNSTTDRHAPVTVVGLSSIVAVTAGGVMSCALTGAGGVKCWGYNAFGALGNGSTTQSLVPVDVMGLSSGVVSIAAGGSHVCALTSGGGVKCWGYDVDGELGNGLSANSSVPVDVSGLTSGVLSVAAGFGHTCAVTTGGAVKCWGQNEYGQLGNNTTTASNVPVAVMGLSAGAAALDLGDHTCAVLSTGAVKCWGRNDYGQLGDGTTTQRHVPVDVTGLSGVVTVSASQSHTCALSAGGGIKCWGFNGFGELGDGTTTDRHAPVDVMGLSSGVAAVTAGYGHVCAVLSAAGMECWGDDLYGELGNSTSTSSSVPVHVTGF